jgi:formamidase
MANPPIEKGALLGQLTLENNRNKWKEVANQGARTIPPREHGGNNDIKNLSRGSRIYLPVYVNGAKLSLGDIHFSQGDGEISFCGAIEMVKFKYYLFSSLIYSL